MKNLQRINHSSEYSIFVPSYNNTMIIRIDTENNLERQIQDALMSLTTSKVKQHILICSASILQDDEHGLHPQTVKDINVKDKEVLKAYNKCLAEYGKLNLIHSNITIFHCVIGETTKFRLLDQNIPRLKTVYIKNSNVPVFNKIVNFCSLQPTLYNVHTYTRTHTNTRFGSLYFRFLQVRQCFHSSTIPTSCKLLPHPLFLTKKAFQLLRHKTASCRQY